MNVLTDQTLYQCEYCNKRFITKQGAKKHEEDYCYLSPIPKVKRLKKIRSCNHEWQEKWRRIPGEDFAMEPDYSYCYKCNVTEMELREIGEPT